MNSVEIALEQLRTGNYPKPVAKRDKYGILPPAHPPLGEEGYWPKANPNDLPNQRHWQDHTLEIY